MPEKFARIATTSMSAIVIYCITMVALGVSEIVCLLVASGNWATARADAFVIAAMVIGFGALVLTPAIRAISGAWYAIRSRIALTAYSEMSLIISVAVGLLFIGFLAYLWL